MKKGYIALYRKIQNNWLYKEKPFSKFQAFVDILLEVNHSGQKVCIGNQLFDCKRGESLNSLETWAKRWGWEKSKVRRFLMLLKGDSIIDTLPHPKTTHLKVLNYDTYQNNRNADETQMKRKRNANETHLTPNNNVNNVNNVNNEINTGEVAEELNGRFAQSLFDYWNTKTRLPKVIKLSDKRKKSIKIRAKESFFVDHWKEAIDRLDASDFATGKNERGWKASIEWLTHNDDNITKVIEGKYDNRTRAIAGKPNDIGFADQKSSRTDYEFEV